MIAEIEGAHSHSSTFPVIPTPLVDRGNLVTAIFAAAEKSRYVLVTGVEGIGKTVLLAQFAQTFPQSTASLFLTPGALGMLSRTVMLFELSPQVAFIAGERQQVEGAPPTAEEFGHQLIRLARRAKQRLGTVFFVVDAFGEQPVALREEILEAVLPVGLAPDRFRFILSARSRPAPNSRGFPSEYVEIQVPGFSRADSIQFLADEGRSQAAVSELAETVDDGHPGRLALLRKELDAGLPVQDVVDIARGQFRALIATQWARVVRDQATHRLLAAIAFSRTEHTSTELSRAIGLAEVTTTHVLRELPFLVESRFGWRFASPAYQQFAQDEYADRRAETAEALASITLPGARVDIGVAYLSDAQRYEDVLDRVSVTGLAEFASQTADFALVAGLSQRGVEAAHQLARFGPELKLTVLSSLAANLKHVRGHELLASIYLRLGRHEDALNLAASCTVQSERLVLLARTGRVQKMRTGATSPDLSASVGELLVPSVLSALSESELVDLGADLIFISPTLALQLARVADPPEGASNGQGPSLLTRFALAAQPMLPITERPSAFKALVDEAASTSDRIFLTALSAEDSEAVGSALLVALTSEHETLSPDSLAPLATALARLYPSSAQAIIEALVDSTTREASLRVPRLQALSGVLEIARTQSESALDVDLRERIGRLLDAEPSVPNLDAVELRAAALAISLPRLSETAIRSSIEEALTWPQGFEDGALALRAWGKVFWVTSLAASTGRVLVGTHLGTAVDAIRSHVGAAVSQSANHDHVLAQAIRDIAAVDLPLALELSSLANTEERRDTLLDISVIEHLRSPDSPRTAFDAAFQHIERVPITRLPSLLDGVVAAIGDADDLTPQARDGLVSWFLQQVRRLPRGERSASILADLSRSRAWDSDDAGSAGYEVVTTEFLGAIRSITEPWVAAAILARFARRPGRTSATETRLDEFARSLSESGGIASEDMNQQYLLTAILAAVAIATAADDGFATPADIVRLGEGLARLPSPTDRVIVLDQLLLRLWRGNAGKDLVPQVAALIVSQLELTATPLTEDDVSAHLAAAPALYIAARATFDTVMKRLPAPLDGHAWTAVAATLVRSRSRYEPYFGEPEPRALDLDTALQLHDVIPRLSEDSDAIGVAEFILRSLEKFPTCMPESQKRHVVSAIRASMSNRFPSSTGVSHEGYRIWIDALISRADSNGSLKGAALDGLRKRARAIPNTADKAYVLSVLAELASRNGDSLDLLAEAERVASGISIGLERTSLLTLIAERLDDSRDVAGAKRILKEMWPSAFSDVAQGHGFGVARRRALELAYSISPDFARQLGDLLDDDASRLEKRLAAKRSRQLDLRRAVLDSSGRVELTELEFDHRDLAPAVWDAIGRINAGRATAKNPSDVIRELGPLALEGMSEGFPALLFLLECVATHPGKRYARGSSSREVVDGLLDAVDFAHHSFKLLQGVGDELRGQGLLPGRDQVFGPGERARALQFFREWLSQHATKQVVLVDPYFRVEDLDFLTLCLESCPRVPVTIVTSHEAVQAYAPNVAEAFVSSWRNAFDQAPPESTIIVIGTRGTGKSPFHDRYLFGDTRALMLGNSYASIGGTRVCSISQVPDANHSRLVAEFVSPVLRGTMKLSGTAITRFAFALD